MIAERSEGEEVRRRATPTCEERIAYHLRNMELKLAQMILDGRCDIETRADGVYVFTDEGEVCMKRFC